MAYIIDKIITFILFICHLCLAIFIFHLFYDQFQVLFFEILHYVFYYFRIKSVILQQPL